MEKISHWSDAPVNYSLLPAKGTLLNIFGLHKLKTSISRLEFKGNIYHFWISIFISNALILIFTIFIVRFTTLHSEISHVDSEITHVDSVISHVYSVISHMDSEISHVDFAISYVDFAIFCLVKLQLFCLINNGIFKDTAYMEDKDNTLVINHMYARYVARCLIKEATLSNISWFTKNNIINI